ncbi:single-stranded DNA-binding protein, mitochondrial-like [Coffea eugenioides]|uniref:Single-stranded DNA-binding protein, mitochondrial n=1 Tax=Coffea arabica TaxID=13443 RepID=A0A6P6XBU9_COFAR|nr:single-stranded DNA-binding protein, mitochondrial-like [Coffea arabica]XP_027167780.1 single-stranded DNA-binding protein, mitochondrial-like [Coffea eugenioides]XP_027168115.1 single-stranded DNA-binding protein, mitochondrial-like [Coffea eugenioides]
MASSLSRTLCRRLLLSNPRSKPSTFSYSFCSKSFSFVDASSESDEPSTVNSAHSDAESAAPSSFSVSSSDSTKQQRVIRSRPLENGLDVGIYKAVLIGLVGQAPLQKKLRNGKAVTMLSLGTGGIRNNRRPFDNEEPREFADRCAVQWHRVAVYPERLGALTVKHAVPGSVLYVEGNLETKIFNDPITGLVRRIREIAIRRNGRLVFLGQGSDNQKPSQGDLRSVGYY